VVEVESQAPRLDQGAGLRGVLAEPVSQDPVQHVSRRVGALRAGPPYRVDERLDLVADLDLSRGDPDPVSDHVRQQAPCV
jgi:hypothetical protein